MERFKTSTQIAIKFTLYFFVIFSLLGFAINGIFFRQRTNNEYRRIAGNAQLSQPATRGLGGRVKDIQAPIINVEYKSDIADELQENKITKTISRIEGGYIMYRIADQNIKILDVSRPIEMQYNLLWTTLFIVLGGTIITFAISRTFAKSSLQKINELVEYTKQLDIHNLSQQVPLSGPEDDEIRIIASAFQKSLDIIKEQTDSLKDFVSYASHELKTPLSTIRGLVDLRSKTNETETTGKKIKKTLTEMSDLLDSLLLITRREFGDIHRENIDIIAILQESIDDLTKQYELKGITCMSNLPDTYIISGKNEIIKIIFSNLLNNAYKFTPDGGSISINLENNSLSVTDTGKGISPTDQQKIWKRFWKKSTSENQIGFGLGLYMVKLLVEKLGRTIQVESNLNKGSTFTIALQ